MVNPNVALACASAGAVLVTVGFALGIAFMTSSLFATAGLQCNPDVLTSEAAQTTAQGFCTADNEVTNAAGEVCQIANLGLYSAAYTPECTQADATNPYALSALLAPQSGAPADISVLFPTQTRLGTLPAGLQIPAEQVPEFTTCEAFFAGTAGFGGTSFASLATTNAGTGGIAIALTSFQETVKAQYDAGVAQNLVDLEESAFTLIGGGLATAMTGVIAQAIAPSVASFSYDDGMGQINATSWTDVASGIFFPKLTATIVALVELGKMVQPAVDDVRELAIIGLFVDRNESGIPSDGIWGEMNSDILCDNLVGSNPCTGIDHIANLITVFTNLGASGADTVAELSLAQFALQQYLAGVNFATNQSLTDDAVEFGVAAGSPSTLAAFSTEAVIAGVQSGYDPSAALDSPTGFPDDPTVAMNGNNPSFALVCAGAGQVTNCTTLELLVATSASLGALNDTDGQDDVNSVLLIASSCGANGWTACALSGGNPAITSAAYRAGTMFTVFGSLYGLEEATVLEGEAALIAAMVKSCEDDVKDLAAISTVQTLAPIGTAFLGLGALILIANLFVRGDKVKIIGVVGGLVCLIGTIIVIAGLLVLQGAPIYAALGAEPEDPLPDNVTSFSLAGGYTIVLAFLGIAVVGSVVAIIGGALLTPKEDASSAILGKA